MAIEFEHQVHAKLPDTRIERLDFTLIGRIRSGPKLLVNNGRYRYVRLNGPAYEELGCPDYVQVGVDTKAKVLMVRPCKADDDNAFKLPKSLRLIFGYKTADLFASGLHSVAGKLTDGEMFFKW